MDDQKDNAELLNEIAWFMVDPKNPFEKPDLDLALKAAERANELAKGEVHHAEHAPDQGHAETEQGISRPEGNAVDGLLQHP